MRTASISLRCSSSRTHASPSCAPDSTAAATFGGHFPAIPGPRASALQDVLCPEATCRPGIRKCRHPPQFRNSEVLHRPTAGCPKVPVAQRIEMRRACVCMYVGGTNGGWGGDLHGVFLQHLMQRFVRLRVHAGQAAPPAALQLRKHHSAPRPSRWGFAALPTHRCAARNACVTLNKNRKQLMRNDPRATGALYRIEARRDVTPLISSTAVSFRYASSYMRKRRW